MVLMPAYLELKCSMLKVNCSRQLKEEYIGGFISFFPFEHNHEARKTLKRSWHQTLIPEGSSLPDSPLYGLWGWRVLQLSRMCFHLTDRCSALCGVGNRTHTPLSSESHDTKQAAFLSLVSPSIFSNIF